MGIKGNDSVIKEIYVENDFAKVFKVFREHPYNEQWTNTQIRQEYFKLKEKGKVLGYYIDKKCVGLITFYQIIPGEHPVVYLPNQKVLYFSDVAVLPEYRNNGIASKLIEVMINYAKLNCYDIIYMRTMQPNISMSYSIVIKLGFKLINNVTENKEMQRTNGKKEIDTRIFLEYKIKGGICYDG